MNNLDQTTIKSIHCTRFHWTPSVRQISWRQDEEEISGWHSPRFQAKPKGSLPQWSVFILRHRITLLLHAQACLQPLTTPRPRLRHSHSLVYSVKPGAVVIPLPVLVQERKGEETHQWAGQLSHFTHDRTWSALHGHNVTWLRFWKYYFIFHQPFAEWDF